VDSREDSACRGWADASPPICGTSATPNLGFSKPFLLAAPILARLTTPGRDSTLGTVQFLLRTAIGARYPVRNGVCSAAGDREPASTAWRRAGWMPA